MSDDIVWISESDAPRPTAWTVVGDAAKADDALKRVRRGEWLLYEGDFHNAKQLVAAMGRRIKGAAKTTNPLAAFRAERLARAQEHETLGRLLVELDAKWRAPKLKRAPEGLAVACELAWGKAKGRSLVSLKTLLGVLGAAEWTKKGLDVPGLKKKLVTRYGVYVPTRTDYLDVLSQLSNVKGAKCFDIGTGTGVLALLLLQKGAASVVGTDVEPRAIACARENAKVFGETKFFSVEERPLFPEGRADLIVCNPPWVPEVAKNRFDRAVFDEGGAMLSAFLSGLREHLTPGGRGALIISNLAELLGLRESGALEAQFAAKGLRCVRKINQPAKHGKSKDVDDPLHAVRSKEVTTLYELMA
ncbi:MAG: class I SAM-dependent methyltransferase [Archangium sp.]